MTGKVEKRPFELRRDERMNKSMIANACDREASTFKKAPKSIPGWFSALPLRDGIVEIAASSEEREMWKAHSNEFLFDRFEVEESKVGMKEKPRPKAPSRAKNWSHFDTAREGSSMDASSKTQGPVVKSSEFSRKLPPKSKSGPLENMKAYLNRDAGKDEGEITISYMGRTFDSKSIFPNGLPTSRNVSKKSQEQGLSDEDLQDMLNKVKRSKGGALEVTRMKVLENSLPSSLAHTPREVAKSAATKKTRKLPGRNITSPLEEMSRRGTDMKQTVADISAVKQKKLTWRASDHDRKTFFEQFRTENMYSEEEIKDLLDSDYKFSKFKEQIRQSGAVTNEVLRQVLFAYMKRKRDKQSPTGSRDVNKK